MKIIEFVYKLIMLSIGIALLPFIILASVNVFLPLIIVLYLKDKETSLFRFVMNMIED